MNRTFCQPVAPWPRFPWIEHFVSQLHPDPVSPDPVSPKTGPGTPDYRKAYAACRGQEHLHEAFWKGQTPSLSANTQAPISKRKLSTPIGQEYLAEGRNAGLEFCRGRYWEL